ncbi:MAG TPA: SRPBCC family protein [Chloroflexota bacterium]|nr:SRPBCC family protein [Chloroflexota bacterium]
MDVRRAVTILRPAEELYRFWHDPANLARVFDNVESIESTGERRSHWRVKGPMGVTAEWDAEITEDRPNELIAWRSLPGATVENSGSVRFTPAPGDRGTEILVDLHYQDPAGSVGTMIAKVFRQAPGQQLLDDLRALKQLMETGEVTQSDSTLPGAGPAQPPGGTP